MQVERRVPLNPLDLALVMARVEATERHFPDVDSIGDERRDVDTEYGFGDHPLRDKVLDERRRRIVARHLAEVRARRAEAD